MNKLLRFTAVALAITALLAGCYLELNDGSGNVGIQLPDPVSSVGAPPADTGRVYVLNGANLLPLDGGQFKEFSLGSGDTTLTEITVGPVPSGPGYRVVLVFGNNEPAATTGTVFVPSEYALSAEFTVAAGAATPVDLTTTAAGSTPASMLGRSLVGVVGVPGAVVTATGSTLFELDVDLEISADVSLGLTATSLNLGQGSAGAPQAWVNTATGILPYTIGSGLGTLNFGDTVSIGPVLSSGGFYSGSDVYGFFQTDGGLGGFRDVGATGVAIDWLENVDLSGLVTGRPVYSLAVDLDGEVKGYFATKLGAFKLDEGDLQGNYESVTEVFENADFFSVTIDGSPALITNVAISGATLWIGTPRGVLTIPKATVGNVSKINADLVPGTRGLVTRRIAVGTNYQAILTDHIVFVRATGGSWKPFPVYAGVSGQVSGMFLDNANGIVLLAGDKGLSAFDITAIP